MKLFGFYKKKRNDKFRITESDRLWVENNFKWLIKVFGFPVKESEQILLTEDYFPNTFKADIVLIDNIIRDLCLLLQINESKVTFEVITDIRDSYGLPYEIEGKAFETDFQAIDGCFKIIIANNLQKHHKRLIYCLIYEFIRIKLTDNNLQFDTGDDTDLFIYLAGIYFGFGIILSQNLKDTGRVDDGFWETKWNYISDMPNEIMAFGLATYSKLFELNTPKWKERLPSELKDQFEKAIKDFFEKSFASATGPVDLLEYHYADFLFRNGKIDEGLEYLKKAVAKGEPEAINKMNEIKINNK